MRYLLLITLAGCMVINAQPKATPLLTPKKVLFHSIVCPAWGMRELNRPQRARVYLLNDIALLIGYWGLKKTGDWEKEAYRIYAVEHAGIRNPETKNDAFFRDLKFYMSVYDHDLVAANEPYADEWLDYWQWETDEHRRHYEKLRNHSESAYNNASFMIAGVILNHLVGAIDAMRIFRSQQNIAIQSSIGNQSYQVAFQLKF